METTGKKAIILARVSTLAQDYSQQVKELVKAAVNDGYDENNLIVIENKESATSKDEEHRLGLTEMKEAIENDQSINCVYVREVSRIGRRYDVLNSMRGFFVGNKIQLIVTASGTKLLKEDGFISREGGLMFEIAFQVAEQEMTDKAVRFKEGKTKAVRIGKTASGQTLFGYKTDQEKYIRVNEEEANVVRLIFETYISTKQSTKAIYRELVDKGLMKRLGTENTGANKIRRIICNPAYSGGTSNNGEGEKRTSKVYQYKYPAIISEVLQQQAIAKCKAAKQQPKYITKHIWYAKSLVKCSCGHIMTANTSSAAYVCPYCGKHQPLNQIDHIAWSSAIQLQLTAQKVNQTETRNQYTKDITENDVKIEVMKKRLVELVDLEEAIVESSLRITDSVRRKMFQDKKLEEVNSERKKINQSILKLSENNNKMKQYLNNLFEVPDDMPLLEITDDSERKKIIDRVIDSITLEDIDDKHVKITVIPNKAITNQYCYNYIYDKSTMPYPRLIENYLPVGTSEDITKMVVKRIKHHRTRLRQLKQIVQASPVNMS